MRQVTGQIILTSPQLAETRTEAAASALCQAARLTMQEGQAERVTLPSEILPLML